MCFILLPAFSYVEDNNVCIVNYWYCMECSDLHEFSDLKHVESSNVHRKQYNTDVHCYGSHISH